MRIRFDNKFTGEINELSIENNISKRTLTDKLNRLYGRRGYYTYGDWDLYTCPPRIFPQKIIIGEILQLLPVVLKYSPLIVTPEDDDSKNSYILFKSKREIKVFSLKDGEYKKIELLDLQKSYIITSTNDLHGGLSKEISEVFEATRPIWEGKLRLAYTNRDTIRENLTPDKSLRATNEEIKSEAALRLRLLGLNDAEYFIRDGTLTASAQKYMRYMKSTEEGADNPIYLRDESFYYNRGIEDGIKSTRREEDESSWYWLKNTRLVHHKDTLWALRFAFDDISKHTEMIKEIEHSYDLLVYYLHYTQGTDGNQMLSMLYVDRNIDEWEYTRKRTLEGNPEACVKALGSELRLDFGSIGIKVIENCLFRTY